MHASQAGVFRDLLTDVMAYYGKDVSNFTMDVWWGALQQFDYEQVERAMQRHAVDPERGRFAPKVADVVALLQGTQTDRSAVAWGKTLEAMQSVGAYTDVVFDDPAIHAVVEDLGGWPKLCRTEMAELGYVQTAFGKAYRAYAAQERFEFVRRLVGDRCEDSEYESRGLTIPMAMIGDRAKCQQVFQLGGKSGKVAITHTSVQALAAIGMRRMDEPPQDAQYRQLSVVRK